MTKTTLHFLVALMACLLLALPAAAKDIASVSVNAGEIVFMPEAAAAGFQLTVTGPGGYLHQATFDGAGAMSWAAVGGDGLPLADGAYTYELRLVAPRVKRGEAAETAGAKPGVTALSGTVTVRGGSLVNPERPETSLTKDQVILDDLIVDGSICAGLDCVNGESFGFDTLRLKENNLRIKFDDTSSSASFPDNDWQITANDSSNGGAEKFSIDDISGGRTPFTIEAGAPSHSLYVDDGGRIGFGTSTPVVNLHVKEGNTPTLRLEQDGSSGFTPQTWDVAGNETNFFVRDATNGSKLPFRIKPSAPSNSIFVDTDGDVGLGTTSPAADGLHINSASGASGTSRELIRLTNNGGVFITFDKTTAVNDDWFFTVENVDSGDFIIDSLIGGVGDGPEFALDVDGNLTLAGTVTAPSDRNLKHDIVPVDAREILGKVMGLPISEWSYKANNPSLRHIGPMAQDFYAAFGLDQGDQRIALTDLSGVALAAIQGLSAELSARDQTILELEARLAQLEARVLKTAE